jgi:UDP-glucose 4-epimerase
MRLFLTGGTGFIGSYVLRAALASGHQVRALRRSSTARPVIDLPCEPQWVTGTLQTLDPVQMAGVDAVIHLASAGVSPKQASWEELVEANVVGSLRVLEIGVLAEIRRFAVAGTCHEYGATADRYEEIPPNATLEPLNSYGASKAAAFQLLKVFAIERGLELFYGRIFNAYGDGQYEKNFWPSLRKAGLAGEDFPMTSGQQVSDFIPAQDVAQYFVEACIRPDIKAGMPLVANIGSGTASTLLSFAQQQWRHFEARGKLLPSCLPDRPNQIRRYVPDLRSLSILPPNHS